MNKLTVCVYPMATIQPAVSVITGLDNYISVDKLQLTQKLVSSLITSLLGYLHHFVWLLTMETYMTSHC
jgi:hypothetical protein